MEKRRFLGEIALLLSSSCASDWCPPRSEVQYGILCEIGGGKERMMGYWDQIGYTEGNWELAKKLHERKTKIFMDLIENGKIPLRAGAAAAASPSHWFTFNPKLQPPGHICSHLHTFSHKNTSCRPTVHNAEALG